MEEYRKKNPSPMLDCDSDNSDQAIPVVTDETVVEYLQELKEN